MSMSWLYRVLNPLQGPSDSSLAWALAVLASQANEEGEITISAAEFGRISRCSRDTAVHRLRGLLQQGWIERERSFSEAGGVAPNKYKILAEKRHRQGNESRVGATEG